MALFTAAEAKAFKYQGQMSLASFDDEDLEAAELRIRQAFEDICGVAFAPTETTEEIDGGTGDTLALPDDLVTAVATVESWDGAAWAAVETGGYRLIAGGVLLRGGGAYWPRGRASVRATYTHGYAEPPLEIKRAALILATEQLRGSNISARATQQTNENGTFNLAVPGWREGQYFGLPEVDAVLAREAAKWKGPRVG